MSQPITERVRWTTADLELLPDNGNRYEIIDGAEPLLSVYASSAAAVTDAALMERTLNRLVGNNPT